MEGVSQEELQRTIGVRFIGCILSLILEGAVLTQTWDYYQRFGGKSGDPRWTQLLVAICVLATVAQSVLLFWAMYQVHVLEFGNPAFIQILPRGIGYAAALTPVASAGAQVYFARRCWIILGYPKWFIATFAVLISYVFIGGFVVAWAATAAGSFEHVRTSLVKGTYSSWLVVCVVVDLAITSILCFKLYKARKQTAYRDTSQMLAALMTRTMETSAITSLLIILTTVLYFAASTQSYYVLPYEPITKVYASSLLVHLSARSFERHDRSGTDTSSSGGVRVPRFRTEHSLGRAQREMMDSTLASDARQADVELKPNELEGSFDDENKRPPQAPHSPSVHVSRTVVTSVEKGDGDPEKDRRPMVKRTGRSNSPPPV